MYRLLLFFLFWGVVQVAPLQAQDPHFSQFNAAPLQINPAMTGVYEGQFRVGINYRDQWGSIFGPVSYQTYAVNFDFRFYALKQDYVALGISLLGDQAGEARYGMTQGHFTLSFLKKIFGGRGYRYDQYLVGAGQFGFGQQGINWNTLRFSRQFNGQTFDPNLPSGEITGDQSDMYGDVNAGLMWYGLFGEARSAYGGVAFHHVNAPNISFYGDRKETIYMRWTIHGGGEVMINRGLSVMPSAIFQRQGPSFQFVGGTEFRFSTREWDEFALRVGLFSRISGRTGSGTTADAVITKSAIEWHDWVIGLSYDANISSLSTVSGGRGAFELSLTYVNPPKRRAGMFCPRF